MRESILALTFKFVCDLHHQKSLINPYHCCKCWSAQAWELLGNVHMCPSLCANMYTAPVYKGWPSSSSSVQRVSKFVHMLCTNWALAWAHVYISKQFSGLGTPSVTAWTQLVHICEQVSFQVGNSNLYCSANVHHRGHVLYHIT